MITQQVFERDLVRDWDWSSSISYVFELQIPTQ